MESERRPPRLVDDRDNVADLVAQMSHEDQEEYGQLRHIFTEAAFVNRRFYIVRTKGRRGKTPISPDILGAVRVVGFSCDHERGSMISLMNDRSSRILQVGHVPTRLFAFPAFVSVPIFQGLKWEAKEQADGRYTRTLLFGICFKQQSNVKFCNPNAVAVVTPNMYRATFGEAPPIGV